MEMDQKVDGDAAKTKVSSNSREHIYTQALGLLLSNAGG